MLEISALRSFADNGYTVVRDVVPKNLIDSANDVLIRTGDDRYLYQINPEYLSTSQW